MANTINIELEKVVELLKLGLPMERVGRHFGVSGKTIRTKLALAGLRWQAKVGLVPIPNHVTTGNVVDEEGYDEN